jgi:hypothetical protein
LAIEYFGEVNSDGSIIASPDGEDNNSSISQLSWNVNCAIPACPGSGTYNVKSLAAYNRLSSAGTGYISLGVYTTGGSLICQTDMFAITNTSLQWNERLAANMAGTLTLTGGVSYYMASYAHTGKQININYKTGSDGDMVYQIMTDYSGSLPASLPSPYGTWTGRYYIRCGVEAASGYDVAPAASTLSVLSSSPIVAITGATWKEAENTSTTVPLDTTIRLRIGVDTDIDTDPMLLQLEYRKQGETQWRKVYKP